MYRRYVLVVSVVSTELDDASTSTLGRVEALRGSGRIVRVDVISCLENAVIISGSSSSESESDVKDSDSEESVSEEVSIVSPFSGRDSNTPSPRFYPPSL